MYVTVVNYHLLDRSKATSLATVLLESQNLDETDEDVDHVQLEANRLLERIGLDDAGLSELCVVQDLLSAEAGCQSTIFWT
jgi:hypothetical protein